MITIDTLLFIIFIILGICFGYLLGVLCKVSGINEQIDALQERIFLRDLEIKELKEKNENHS